MAEVRASHILIKHQGSRRPASWLDPEGKVIKKTTKEHAIEQLRAIREKIISGELDFVETAKKKSHCGSASRGGDLGR